MPTLSVIVPTRDSEVLTLRCLHSLAERGGPPLEGAELIVVDDGSADGTTGSVATRHPAATVLRQEEPRGFTAAANRGLSAARGDLLLLLNSDTELTADGLTPLVEAFAADPELGVAGATLRYPDGSPQWSGGRLPTLPWLIGLASDVPRRLSGLSGYRRLVASRRRGDVDWVSGAAMALRRRVWQQVGPLDPRFALYCQDLDFCLRAGDLGWRVAVLPGWRVVHHHGATIGELAPVDEGRRQLAALWLDLVRWSRKRGDGREAARTAAALRLGGQLRRFALRLAVEADPGSTAKRTRLAAVESALASLEAIDERPVGTAQPRRAGVPR